MKWACKRHTYDVQASNAQLSYENFGSVVCSNFFFRILLHDGFFKFNWEKDCIAATWDSFKDFILACKMRNQMYANFEKGKVPRAVISNFTQKWLCCKAYALFYLRPKFLNNTFEILCTYYRLFSRKIQIHIYWTATSITVMGFFGAAAPQNLSHISYNDGTWHSYTLSKKVPKTIWITWHTPRVQLTSALLYRKSGNFVILRNTDINPI